MAGDPRAWREYAWRCAELAQSAYGDELKMLLIELSKNWLNIAIQLDRSQALLDENPLPEKPAAPRGGAFISAA
jgi:hypothetical protein